MLLLYIHSHNTGLPFPLILFSRPELLSLLIAGGGGPCLVVSDSATPWTVATRLLCPGFSRQEYWSGLPFPTLGDLPNPEIEPDSPALKSDSLPTEPPGKPCITHRGTVSTNLQDSCGRQKNAAPKIQISPDYLATVTVFPHLIKRTLQGIPWQSSG